MRLDIISYQLAELTEDHKLTDACYDIGHLRHVDPDFPLSSLDLQPGRCYIGSGTRRSFSAGSYSGYGQWRSMLCRSALGVEPHVVWDSAERWKESPFFELINFSDCEGMIGPLAAASLHEDFSANRELVTRVNQDAGHLWFVDLYNTWEEAFALAANHGLVLFC